MNIWQVISHYLVDPPIISAVPEDRAANPVAFMPLDLPVLFGPPKSDCAE
jgi:hypothetical protein